MTTNVLRSHGPSRGLAILGLALIAAGCVNPNAIGVQDSGSVSGRVIDAKTQQPVAKAYVSINALLTKQTGGDGSFTISGVPIGTQTVTVYANGYATSTVQVVVTKDNNSDAGLISLTPTF
jgi:hypothetical protein